MGGELILGQEGAAIPSNCNEAEAGLFGVVSGGQRVGDEILLKGSFGNIERS